MQKVSQTFIYKLSMALKEANETQYWIELLDKSNFIDEKRVFNQSRLIVQSY